jgi:hypothetical protein
VSEVGDQYGRWAVAVKIAASWRHITMNYNMAVQLKYAKAEMMSVIKK